ncbi:MAG: YybS family protein [Firmicutes bacterium]|nr:YybS family protein [Bacillota bacterium]
MPADRYPFLLRWLFYAALTFLAGLGAVSPTPLFFPCALAMPLPVALAVLKTDVRYGFLALVAAGALLSLFSSPAAAFSVSAHYGMLGVVYGLLFKNNAGPGKSIFWGAVTAVVFTSLSLALLYALTGENPLSLGKEERSLMLEWLNYHYAGGLLPGGPDFETAVRYLEIFELFLPGQIFVSVVATAVIIYYAVRFLLGKLRFTMPPAPAFSRLAFPWYTIWLLIAGLALLLLGDQFQLDVPARAGKNILFVLVYFYFFLGLSVAVYYYPRVKLAGPVKLIAVFFAALYIPFSAALLVLLGVADTVANLRRLP